MRYVIVLSQILAYLLLTGTAWGSPPDCPRDLAKSCVSDSKFDHRTRQAVIKTIYDNLLAPTAAQIVSGQLSVANLFEQKYVRGRVTPAGEFPGFEAAVEYFYGLASAGNRVENVKIVSLTSSGDKAAVQVDIFFCSQTKPCANGPVPKQPGYGFTLTQTGFFTFNYANRVIAFDLSILNLGTAVDPSSPQERDLAILQTCGLLTIFPNPMSGEPGTCTATFLEPTSYAGQNPLSSFVFDPQLEIPFPGVSQTPGPAFSNCVAFMQSIPQGSWNRANSNSFTCRQLHSLLTLFNPVMHCPHTSPAGGQTCIDWSYDSFYDPSFWGTPAAPDHPSEHHNSP
jgi:hypothetical protein